MKIVNIIGGLGNQMFQYAFYLMLKDKYDECIKLDILEFDDYELHNGYELERIFSVNEQYCTRSEKVETYDDSGHILKKIQRKLFLNKKLGIVERRMDEYSYKPFLFRDANCSLYYKGYWQSYKYFNSIENIIREKLVFPKMEGRENLSLISKIKSQTTVSIHVRRGDYINHPTLGGVCDLTYYENAIKEIEKKVNRPLYIVFSNDISWCKSHLHLSNAEYVDWNNGDNSFRDLQLMSLCEHNIIANSSFSWWGAWLNTNSNKTSICPDRWIVNKNTDDLIPDSWFRLSVSK